MRRWLIIAAILGVVACATVLPTSGASFTSSSSSNVSVVTDSVSNWLHLYSQSTDPAGLSGYWLKAPSVAPAATKIDENLAVDLGEYDTDDHVTCARVFTIQAAPSFITGTAITVTATLLPDPATGVQPISVLGFQKVGSGNGTPNPVTLGPGGKLQANLKMKLRLAEGVYQPMALITVTYTGMTAAYYQYRVPLTVKVGHATDLAVPETTTAPASTNSSNLPAAPSLKDPWGNEIPAVDAPLENSWSLDVPAAGPLDIQDGPAYDPWSL